MIYAHHVIFSFVTSVLTISPLWWNAISWCGGESNTDEGWNFQENALKQLQNFLAPLLILGHMLSSMSSSTVDQKEVITFLLC